MGAASIPSDLTAQAIPFLDCFVLPRFSRSFGIAPRNDRKKEPPRNNEAGSARNDTPLVVASPDKSGRSNLGVGHVGKNRVDPVFTQA
jgi:hypothetical protein